MLFFVEFNKQENFRSFMFFAGLFYRILQDGFSHEPTVLNVSMRTTDLWRSISGRSLWYISKIIVFFVYDYSVVYECKTFSYK